MEYVHCNKMCGKSLLIDRCQFYFTSCGHIVCDTCHGKAQDSKCPVCSKSTRFVTLEALPKEVRQSYFSESEQSLRQSCQGLFQKLDEANKVVDFQSTQDKHYMKAVNKVLTQMHRQLQAKDEELKSLNNQVKSLQQTLDQMRLDNGKRQQSEREYHGQNFQGLQPGVSRTRGIADGASGPGVIQRMVPQREQENGFAFTQATNRNGGGNLAHTQATQANRLAQNPVPHKGVSGFSNTHATNRNPLNVVQTQNTQRTRVNQNVLPQHQLQGQQNPGAFVVPNAPVDRMAERMFRPVTTGLPQRQTGNHPVGTGRLVSGTSAGGPSAASPTSLRNPSLLSRFGNQGLASTTNRISLSNPLANRPPSIINSNFTSPASSVGRQTMSFLVSPSSAANATAMRHGMRRF